MYLRVSEILTEVFVCSDTDLAILPGTFAVLAKLGKYKQELFGH